MERAFIEKTVNTVLLEEFELDPEALSPSARIRDDLQLDSLDVVDMVIALEEAFQFKLQDRSKILDIRTVQDMYDFIASLEDENVASTGG